MKEYIFPDEDRTIRQYFGSEVALNDEGNYRVEFEFCPANALLYIRRKSFYSDKLVHFESTDALVQRLTLPPVVKPKHDKPKHAPKTAENAPNNVDGNDTPKTSQSTESMLDFAPEDCDEVIIYDENGNITERSRSVEGIKRSYNAIRRRVESTAKSCYSFFLSPTLDSYPTFDEMSKHTADYVRHIKRKFPNFKAAFIFLEPCENGSWHAHLIVCFYIVENSSFENDANKWWSKCNKTESEYQITVRQIVDLKDLEHTLDYLNPLSDKQDNEDDGKTSKRERLPYYLLWCKPFRCSGDVAESVKGTVAKKDIDSLGANEFEPKRRKRTEVYDAQTGEMIYFCEESVFVVEGLLDLKAKLDRIDLEDMIFIADECAQCQRGAPHGTLRKFCGGCIFNSS